jgi:hypothetical protein
MDKAVKLYDSECCTPVVCNLFCSRIPQTQFLFNVVLSKLLVYNSSYVHVRFEVFTAVTLKNGVFWDVTPCGSCKNRRFGES